MVSFQTNLQSKPLNGPLCRIAQHHKYKIIALQLICYTTEFDDLIFRGMVVKYLIIAILKIY